MYAEPLAAGRRVLVFADPAAGLLERLEELGADAVVLLTPDEDLDELRGARFDLVIVANLALFSDPAGLLACVRRVVGDGGAALVAAAKRDAGEASDGDPLDYYALFDLVAREFAEVRMIAQIPFHGVALAEVGDADESPAVSVDTQLADADRVPEAFIALASQRGTKLDPYAIFELPAPEPTEVDRRALEESVALLDEATALTDRTRAELHVTRAQLDERTEALLAVAAQAARAPDLERELVLRSRQAADLSSELAVTRSAALEAGRLALAQAEELATRASRAELMRAQVEPELARMLEAQAAELVGLEGTLRERAQMIRALEAEVARRERLVRELVGALEEQTALHAEEAEETREEDIAAPTRAPSPAPIRAPSPAPVPAAPRAVAADASSATETALTLENAHLRRRLDALSLDLARREGESHAIGWTIAELERKLAQAQASSIPPSPSSSAGDDAEAEPRLAAALDELDALRRALAQEHEARSRAESSEELVRAREELARQATLLEELGEELARVRGSTRNEELR
jgi:SAM-dependent methyltransferase